MSRKSFIRVMLGFYYGSQGEAKFFVFYAGTSVIEFCHFRSSYTNLTTLYADFFPIIQCSVWDHFDPPQSTQTIFILASRIMPHHCVLPGRTNPQQDSQKWSWHLSHGGCKAEQSWKVLRLKLSFHDRHKDLSAYFTLTKNIYRVYQTKKNSAKIFT